MAFNQLLNKENAPITVKVKFHLDIIEGYEKQVNFTVEVNPNYTSYRVIHSQIRVKQIFLDLLTRARQGEIYYTVWVYGELSWSIESHGKIDNLIWTHDPL